MVHDPDNLKARRDESRSQTRRLRLGAVVALLLAVAGVAIALATGSGGDGSTSAADSPGGSGSSGASSAAKATGGGSVAAGDWTRPISTPAQEAAAVARLAKIGKPVYCGGGRNGRYVALTFDDGPGPYTHFAIKKLRQWKARSTFFLVGNRLRDPAWKGWPQREAEIAAIADHSWSHPYLPGLDLASARREVADTKRLAEQVTGTKVQVFRPPYGGRNASIDSISSELGMAQIIWDVDSGDSAGANYAGIQRNVIAGLKPGAIILMHENRGQTIRALPTILPELKRRRLTAVTVPELLALDPPSEAQLAAGPNGCSAALRGSGGPSPARG